jgi:hypothetical protein
MTFQKYLVLATFACMLLLGMKAKAQQTPSNVAYQDQTVRFTIITDGTIRMEWAADGKFVDNKSFIAVNRNYPRVNYILKNTSKSVMIKTSKMTVKYLKGTGKFTASNLSIVSAKGVVPFNWKPGTEAKNNLKGTYRTLDRYDGSVRRDTKQPMKLEEGLLSTDGWTFIDDSKGYLFDNSDWPWVIDRPNYEGQDWYFMAYGHNYKTALKDYITFAGKVPLPPRYAFGYWWSRYWCYTENEMRDLVNDFHNYNIPLDVLVVDMDWHYTEPGKGSWTGFTWNRRLFPNPDGFLKYLKQNDLQITLNLHPAEGIASYEDNFPAMAKWMGASDTTKVIPYEGSNKKYMSGWLNTILRPMEKKGVDFWWLDWQQWMNDKQFKNLSNTWWINYVFFSNMELHGDTRPLLYHRWGGLGNHRYQIGFSGDTYITWASLDFQPYFNSTASNVLYGYWSHDIGGHYGPLAKIDPELYARWIQFGALNPILRTHSNKNPFINKEPWMFDHQYFTVIRDAILQRYSMAPYIYTMARKAYDDALCLCRPMYYDYPENKESFDFKNEYMFGDNILVSPITAPMKDGKATVKVWLPAGNDWYEWKTGTLLKGGQTIERSFALDEYPAYMKAGSILPFYGNPKNLRNNDEPVIVTVFPGKEGTFSMYEDNGNDKDYATKYARTQLTSKKEGNVLTVTIGARKGEYKDMPANRTFSVKVVASAMPQEVMVNGEKVHYQYDGKELALLIDVPETNCNVEKVIKVTYPQDAPDMSDGMIAQMRHIRQAVQAVKQIHAGIVLKEELGTMESTDLSLSYYPNEFKQRVELFRKNFSQLDEILKDQKFDEKSTNLFLQIVR